MDKGTVVTILPPDDPAVQAIFPSIRATPTSYQIAVKFNHVAPPTILHTTEAEILDD